jgi:hypothetical protein
MSTVTWARMLSMCALIAQRSIGIIPRWRLTKHCQRNVNFTTFSDNSGTEPPRVQLRAPTSYATRLTGNDLRQLCTTDPRECRSYIATVNLPQLRQNQTGCGRCRNSPLPPGLGSRGRGSVRPEDVIQAAIERGRGLVAKTLTGRSPSVTAAAEW